MQPSLLLVDDDSGLRLLLNRALTMQGYQFYEASDGIVGLAQFHALQPDLILLDITMPRLDGFAVLKEIRQHDPVVGIIMISALSSNQCKTKAVLGGADGYLHKPPRLQEVFSEVARVNTLVRLRRDSHTCQQERMKLNPLAPDRHTAVHEHHS